MHRRHNIPLWRTILYHRVRTNRDDLRSMWCKAPHTESVEPLLWEWLRLQSPVPIRHGTILLGAPHWIVFCVDCQEWDPDGQQRVDGWCITIIRSLGRISPSWTLHMPASVSEAHLGPLHNDIPVEFVKVFAWADKIDIDLGILGDLFDVAERQVSRNGNRFLLGGHHTCWTIWPYSSPSSPNRHCDWTSLFAMPGFRRGDPMDLKAQRLLWRHSYCPLRRYAVRISKGRRWLTRGRWVQAYIGYDVGTQGKANAEEWTVGKRLFQPLDYLFHIPSSTGIV